MTKKAYLIDAAARQITEVTWETTDDLSKFVGGYIELCCVLPNGDTIYVDEEGLLKAGQRYFTIVALRPDQPFSGNGVMVGREAEGDQYPEGFTNLDPGTPIDALRAMVKFVP